MKTLAFIEQELKKTYPTKIVSDLKRTNEDLYLKLKEYSKEHNTSIKNLLEERDYIYLRKSIIRLYVDDFIELEKAFPDYKISGFYETNNKLYYRILAHAKSLKVSLKKYLNSLGFDYDAREELSNDSTKKDLLTLYPNKIVKGLSTKDNKLYYRVYQQAKKENLSFNDYLSKMGFIVDSVRNVETNKNKETKTNNRTEKSNKNINENTKKTSGTKKTEDTPKKVEKIEKAAKAESKERKTNTRRKRNIESKSKTEDKSNKTQSETKPKTVKNTKKSTERKSIKKPNKVIEKKEINKEVIIENK